MLPHHPISAALVTALAAAETRLVSEVHVPCDVAEDAATEAATNNQGVHNMADTVIASIIEDILNEEGKKSTDPQATADIVEPESKDVHMRAVEEVNKGQPKVEGDPDVPKDIANTEQVTSTKTLCCNSYMSRC